MSEKKKKRKEELIRLNAIKSDEMKKVNFIVYKLCLNKAVKKKT